jgi:hypothetical protein
MKNKVAGFQKAHRTDLTQASVQQVLGGMSTFPVPVIQAESRICLI